MFCRMEIRDFESGDLQGAFLLTPRNWRHWVGGVRCADMPASGKKVQSLGTRSYKSYWGDDWSPIIGICADDTNIYFYLPGRVIRGDLGPGALENGANSPILDDLCLVHLSSLRAQKWCVSNEIETTEWHTRAPCRCRRVSMKNPERKY